MISSNHKLTAIKSIEEAVGVEGKKPMYSEFLLHSYSRSKSNHGLSLVEFSIILPLFLILIFGIIEFGVMMFDKAMMTNASRNAARMATLQTYTNFGLLKRFTKTELEEGTAEVPLDDTDPAEFKPIGEWIEEYCQKHLVSFETGDSFTFDDNVTITLGDDNNNDVVDPGEKITVEIQYQFGFLILSNILDGITLKSEAAMRAE